MNVLFESYVGNFLRKECFKYNSSYKVKLQDREYHLAYIENKKVFQLKPDIVIEIPKQEVQVVSSPLGRGVKPVFEGRKPLGCRMGNDSQSIILDTKWKIPSDSKISISDMYQLYAYGMKYENCNRLYLIYPMTKKKLEYMEFNFNEKNQKELSLKVLYFDLKNDEIS